MKEKLIIKTVPLPGGYIIKKGLVEVGYHDVSESKTTPAESQLQSPEENTNQESPSAPDLDKQQ